MAGHLLVQALFDEGALMGALKTTIDQDHDSIVTYTARSPDMIESNTLGVDLGGPGDIL